MFTDVMGDIETTGTDPNHAAIIQICLVKFNADTREVSPEVFNRCLRIKHRRYWDEETRAWWGKMPELCKSILAKGEDPELVIKDMIKWVGNDELRFWGKPITFDFSFLDSYCKDFGVPMPFNWRTARDLNSFIAGLRHNAEHPESDVEFEGTMHDAFYDTFHQIKVLFHELDKNGHVEVCN
jgi:DNA polymerase III alpha subunit (gram-positive type)